MPHRAPPLLLVSALASGIAALILELQWGRQLALVFGSAQHAVAAVLAAFMIGLGVGALIGGRMADRLQRPALTVAGIEVVLSVLGLTLGVALAAMPTAAARLLPNAASASDPAFVVARFVLAFAILVPPTTLMGATYPLLVRAAAGGVDSLHSSIGRLYAANLVGGVVGVAAAGFAILPTWGIPGTLAAAAAANLVAAAAALAADRRRAPGRASPVVKATALSADTPPLPRSLICAAALSGAVVFGAETLWHRALKMVLANSTVTLTVLLALTLAGLGLGAAAGSPLLRRRQPLVVWGRLQLAAAGLLVIQAALLPEVALLVRLIRPSDGWGRVLVPALTAGGVVILPVAVLFGAAWPLLLTAATPRVDDGGRRIGRMGIANSIGAAAGAAIVGMVVLPAAGFGRSMLVVAAASASMVVIALAAISKPPSKTVRRHQALAGVAAAALAVGVVAAPRFGHVMLPSMTAEDGAVAVLEYHETASGTVLVTERVETGERAMYVDNNAVIGGSYDALKVARMLGLVPTLLHPDPERALVIGFGAGVTTATVAGAPGVDAIDVVEIVPGVVDAAQHFTGLNHGVLGDPRVRLHLNDGRNHLLLHQGPWDIITCDPVHPLYGSAPLYTTDFFSLARDRLAPGGIFCQYLPLHRMPIDAFRRAIATFRTAFPDCRVLFGLGHAMLLGGDGPVDLDWERWRRRLKRHTLISDLGTTALHHPAQIAALLQLDPSGCRSVAAGSPASDLFPRLEFLAPAAYRPGLWRTNARILVEAYNSPIPEIVNLPKGMDAELRRLVAGKRLLLFSLLERTDGNLDGARSWLDQALRIAGDDPEIIIYARQLAAELQGR